VAGGAVGVGAVGCCCTVGSWGVNGTTGATLLRPPVSITF
jgi:hypothetical protein